MTTHHLKIHRQPFTDLVSGRKTGEMRNCADREFREGDQVELFLIDETGNPANKSIVRTITHIQRGHGLPDDICVLSYAAPVAERQEPVAWFTDDHLTDKSATTYDPLVCFRWLSKGWPITPLYTSPPAPVSVVLPARKVELTTYEQLDPDCNHEGGLIDGWNAYDDELKRLTPSL